jgi:CBS domain containing-hemolysin-like protein
VTAASTQDITGLVHTKDLLLLWRSRQEGAFVSSALREIVYVPASLRADLALGEFQRRRVHLAAIQDEYGRTAGIVTMDAILRRALVEEGR